MLSLDKSIFEKTPFRTTKERNTYNRLLDGLRRYSELEGKPITKRGYNDWRKQNNAPYFGKNVERYGTWVELCQKAGVNHVSEYTDEELIQGLYDVYKLNGKLLPSAQEMEEFSQKSGLNERGKPVIPPVHAYNTHRWQYWSRVKEFFLDWAYGDYTEQELINRLNDPKQLGSKQKKIGTLYIHKTTDGIDAYKMGITDNEKNRAAQIDRGTPVDLENIMTVRLKDVNHVEKHLKRLFKHKRIKKKMTDSSTEWFRLDADDIERIKVEIAPYRVN